MTTAQQNAPQLHVGSNVYTRTGEKIGRLRFMVVNQESASVSHLVLEKGMMLNNDVLAPVESVAHVLHRGIFLNLEREQVVELPEFVEKQFHTRESGGNHHEGGGGGGGGRRGKGRYRRGRGRGRDRDRDRD